MIVHWTEAALADLSAAEAYAARHSARYAQAFVDRVFAHVGTLRDHPRIGPEVPEYGDETIRELFEHPYRIVYRLLTDRVDVLAVVHATRRMPRTL